MFLFYCLLAELTPTNVNENVKKYNVMFLTCILISSNFILILTLCTFIRLVLYRKCRPYSYLQFFVKSEILLLNFKSELSTRGVLWSKNIPSCLLISYFRFLILANNIIIKYDTWYVLESDKFYNWIFLHLFSLERI